MHPNSFAYSLGIVQFSVCLRTSRSQCGSVSRQERVCGPFYNRTRCSRSSRARKHTCSVWHQRRPSTTQERLYMRELCSREPPVSPQWTCNSNLKQSCLTDKSVLPGAPGICTRINSTGQEISRGVVNKR